MSNEKQTNNINWKAGLDELTMLPGESAFDSNESWQKLELRLAGKNKGKRTFYYWTAAAAVLIAIMFLGIKFNSKKADPVTAYAAQNNIPADKKEIVQTLPVTTNEENQVTHKTRKNPTINNIKKDTAVSIADNKELNITKNDVAIIKNVANEDSTLINPVAIQQIQQKPVVFPSLKKKMPVIHLNELDKTVDPVEAVAGSNERTPIKSRFFNRQTFHDQNAATGQGGNILRIKLSPQN